MPRGSRSKKSKVEEFEETDEIELRKKAASLAALIRDSKHCVVHTGAGISTSASIPDFRGPTGVWTLKDQGLAPNIDVEFEEALPTYAHMAIYELIRRGYVKYVISQNVDGLHLRSGISQDQLSELHGNVYLEHCDTCHFRYLRDFDSAQDADDNHYTGRRCEQPGCRGKLLDSIIDFGEDLPQEDLTRAEKNASQSDLAVVLGSSLLVTPASTLPSKTLENGGKLAIVNLQLTEYDADCDIRFFAKIDLVMQMVMQELAIDVPIYKIPSKKIMVGSTTEHLEEKPRKRGKQGKQKSEPAAPQNESVARRITFFICGEYGYACPLIESVSFNWKRPETPILLVDAIPGSVDDIKFSGKHQGDLFYIDYMGFDNVAPKRSKKEQIDHVTEQDSVDVIISFKTYCNAAPAKVKIPFVLSEGVQERILRIDFCETATAEYSTSKVINTISKSLEDLQ